MIEKKYKRLLSDTAILGLGTFGAKLLTFLLLPLYTKCLTSAEYSVADIIVQSANLLMPVLALGICETVFRFALDKNINRRSVLTGGLFVILVATLVMVIIYPLLNSITFFEGYMWLIILYAFCGNIHSLFAQYIRARGMTTLFAFQGILSAGIMTILNIFFLAVFKMGVVGYVLSTVISDAIVSLLILIWVRLDIAIRPCYLHLPLVSEMLWYSVPLIPTTIFWWITNVADRYMIKASLGDDINGLYAIAFKAPTVLILLSGIFIEAWQFSAVTQKTASSRQSHAKFFGTVFESFQGLLFISASGLIAFSKVIAIILFNESYYTAWQYMPLLISATVYSSLVTFLGSVYLVDKKSLLSLFTAAVGAIVNIVFNLILIPTPMGANGAALATFLSYFIVFLLRAKDTQRFIRFDLHSKKLVLNTVIIGLQTVFMIFEIQGWLFIQILGIFIILIANFMPILRGVYKVLNRR